MPRSRRGWYWIARLAGQLLASLWLVLASPVAMAGAQGTPPAGWEQAINLSNTATQSETPAIVADPSGMVHVFWAENVDETTNYSNAIFYTRWDGTSWSQPRDILLSPEGVSAVAAAPVAVLGQDGRLHLLFSGGWNSRLYHTDARADEAYSARAWTQPIPLESGTGSTAGHAMAVDTEGHLHVIYGVDLGIDQGIYTLYSTDDGVTWSAPARIPGSRMGSAYMLGDPALAVGQDGTLHAMWFWTTVREFFPPKGLMYARSDDGGSTWSEPVHFADGPFRYPTLATRGGSEVHVMWSGTAEQRQKFYRWSADGGRTWSSPAAIPNLGGFQGTAGMALDSADVLHLVLVGSHPIYGDSLYHYWWSGSNWLGPQVLLEDPRLGSNMANAAVTVSEGNQLHGLVVAPMEIGDELENDIFYAHGQAAAPGVDPVALPTRVAGVVPAPTMRPTAVPTQSPTGEPLPPPVPLSAQSTVERPPDPMGGAVAPFTAGLVAVGLALGAIVVVRVGRRRVGGRS